MNYKLFITSIKTPVIVTEEQAKTIKNKMTDVSSRDETITLGMSVFKVNQVKGLFPAEESNLGKTGVRQELQRAANNCDKCEKVQINGKEQRSGFIQVFIVEGKEAPKWMPNCEVRSKLCICQKTIKELNGIEADDFDKLGAEFTFNE